MISALRVLDCIPFGVFLVSRELEVRYWNPCMEDWTGIPREEIVGKQLQGFFPAFNESRYAARLASVFDQGTPVLLTYRLHGNLFPNRDRTCMERVYHTTISLHTGNHGLAIFTLEDRTEVSNRIREARQELALRIEIEGQLRAALKEKDILFKEIHHRVKNNLNTITSLIRLQGDHIEDDGIRTHLADIESRIQSFALLHETLYRSDVYDRVDAASYLKAVARRLLESAGLHNAQLDLQLAPLELPVKPVLYLGLALVELLTNAFKYGASPGGTVNIVVSLVNGAPGQSVLSVSDQGPGIPEDAAAGRSDSLGLRLVQMMAAELGGVVQFMGNGTANCVVLRFNNGIEQT